MKHTAIVLTLALVAAGHAAAQEQQPIKKANQKDADLGLMKNHDPAVEQAIRQFVASQP